MSDTLLAALPVPFEWNGKTYYLGTRSYELGIQFQQYQEGNARRRITAHRKEMGEDEYSEQMTGWRRDVGSNIYSFGSPLSWEFLWTAQGFREYLWLKIKKGEADQPNAEPFSRDDLGRLCDDEAALADVKLLVMEMDFPKSLLPEGKLAAAALRQRKKIGLVLPSSTAADLA